MSNNQMIAKKIDLIHNNMEQFIIQNPVKLFNQNLFTKRDIVRIQRQRAFLRAIKSRHNNYEQPKMTIQRSQTSNRIDPFSPEDLQRAKSFIKKMKHEKQYFQGKLQTIKRKQKSLREHQQKRQKQMEELTKQLQKEKRKERAMYNLEFSKFRIIRKKQNFNNRVNLQSVPLQSIITIDDGQKYSRNSNHLHRIKTEQINIMPEQQHCLSIDRSSVNCQQIDTQTKKQESITRSGVLGVLYQTPNRYGNKYKYMIDRQVSCKYQKNKLGFLSCKI